MLYQFHDLELDLQKRSIAFHMAKFSQALKNKKDVEELKSISPFSYREGIDNLIRKYGYTFSDAEFVAFLEEDKVFGEQVIKFVQSMAERAIYVREPAHLINLKELE